MAPAVGSATSSRSASTHAEQPGSPCGSSAVSGNAIGVTPLAISPNDDGGRPVARARNVEPSHGSVVAVSTFAPPAPVQPGPDTTAVAGQVVVISAKYGERMPSTVRKS